MEDIIYSDTSKTLVDGRCKISRNMNLPAHYHKQTEFVYVLGGEVSLCVNGGEHLLGKDSFAVLRSLDIHSFSTAKSSRLLLVILPDVLSLKLSDTNVTSGVYTAANAEIKGIAAMYAQFYRANDKYLSVYYRLIYEAVKSLYGLNLSETNAAAGRIIEYINRHYREPLTLGDVADACRTNRSYVSGATNKIFRIGFNQYLNRLRIAAFLDEFMANGNADNIEPLALKVGFGDIRTFYRAFSRELNCTPTQYLKSNNSEHN